MRGFTSISEALKPEELREYINEYLTTMSAIIISASSVMKRAPPT